MCCRWLQGIVAPMPCCDILCPDWLDCTADSRVHICAITPLPSCGSGFTASLPDAGSCLAPVWLYCTPLSLAAQRLLQQNNSNLCAQPLTHLRQVPVVQRHCWLNAVLLEFSEDTVVELHALWVHWTAPHTPRDQPAPADRHPVGIHNGQMQGVVSATGCQHMA